MFKKTFALLAAAALATVCLDASAAPPAPTTDAASATQLAKGAHRYRYVHARIINVQMTRKGLKITLNRGASFGVKKGATGLVYRDEKLQKPARIMGSKIWFRITKVRQRTSEAIVKETTLDQINQYRHVDIRVPR
jgi:hypothetical protein